jgi:predicted nucleic acid-binding Zn ribbon protein
VNMREFQCANCGHIFRVPRGTGISGNQMSCPKCGGVVHRVDSGGLQGRGTGFNRGRGLRGNGFQGKL